MSTDTVKRVRSKFDAFLLIVAVAGFLACLALLCGCAAGGRVTLVKWDSREPEQIRAAAEETRALVYREVPDTARDAGAARAFNSWNELFELLAKLRVLIVVGSVEWGESPAAPSPATAPSPAAPAPGGAQ